jgi:hypothetical protein
MLFMNVVEIPDLTMDSLHYESHGLAHMVIWSNLEISRYVTIQAAKASISYQHLVNHDPRAYGARLFAWDQTCWTQII